MVTPTSGTVALYRDTAGGNTYLAASAITVGTTSIYTLPAIAASEPLSSLWTAAWSVVYNTLIYGFRQRAVLVGSRLTPRVADEDLYSLEPDLRHPARLPTGQTSWQTQVSQAWASILRQLTAAGKRPWLAVDDSDLYEWHLREALAMACAAIPGEQGSHYQAAAARYRQESRRAELECRIEYEDEPGYNRAVGPCIIPAAPIGRPTW